MDNLEIGHTFALLGGAACLDFANTIAWVPTDHPVDYLGSYDDLLRWSSQAGLLSEPEVTALATSARARPRSARSVHKRAIALRLAVRRQVGDVVAGTTHDNAALAVLNQEICRAMSRLRLAETPGSGFHWVWDREGESDDLPLDRPLWPVARSAAELLQSPMLASVRLCADDTCGWMFVDESRNHSRRWCSSRDCGNRERVRRHHARKRLQRQERR